MPTRLPLFAILLFLWVSPALGQAYLQVLDPQRWDIRQGSIDAAVLSVHPKGVYFEYGLYLTLSAKDAGFGANDLLEVALYFRLPENAVITDSWLWVEDEIIRAEIMDQWTASNIYEEIVNRQRDPSILFKRGPGDYELRVYPMRGKEQRKVKLTYLVPATITNQSMTAPLPVDLIRASRNPVRLNVLTWPTAFWGSMRIPELPTVPFVERTHEDLGRVKEALLPWAEMERSLSVAVPAPIRNGVFLGHSDLGDGGYYQLALLPSSIFSTSSRRKVALLIDYDAVKTSISRAEVLASARQLLQSTLMPADSFNVILSGLNVKRASNVWLAADSVLIERTFEAFGNDPIASYSNLPTLLADAVDFVHQRGGEGSLLLLASSDQVGSVDVANDLIQDLKARPGELPPVHALDFVTHNYAIHWIGGRYYEGNDYFYTNLTRLTGGNYVHLRTGSAFGDALREVSSTLSGAISSFDLHTTLEPGFTYGRFSSIRNNEPAFLDRAVVQVGRYIGEPPFLVEASGIYQSAPFSRRISVPADDAMGSDSTLTTFWTSWQIEDLMGRQQTNEVIGQIIDHSLEQRILTMYTAFLALEPNMGGEVCGGCRDESDAAATDTEDDLPQATEGAIAAYPNPFSDRVSVNVRLPVAIDGTTVSVRIYNVMGQAVRSLSVPGGLLQEFSLVWDGTNDAGDLLASGVYVLVVTTPTGRYTVKLVLVR